MKYLAMLLLCICFSGICHAQQKQVLDHSAYEIWNEIKESELSPDGQWLLFVLGPEDGDDLLRIRDINGLTNHVVTRAREARFSDDSRFVVAMIKPSRAAVKAAKREGKKAEEMPQDSLMVLNLGDGARQVVPGVKSFQLPEKNGQWLAYLLETQPKTGADSVATVPIAAKKKPLPKGARKEKKQKEKSEGNPLFLQRLDDGMSWQFENVVDYALSKTGITMAFTTSSKDSSADGLFTVLTASAERIPVLTGPGDYIQVTFDETGEQLAFLSNRDTYKLKQPEFKLYHWAFEGDSPRVLAAGGHSDLPKGWWVSEHGKLSFSHKGKRLFFGTAPRPEPEPEDEIPEEEQVNVDIWHWKDPYMMTMQLVDREKELKRSYLAMVDINKKRLLQLADPEIPEVSVVDRGDADHAIGLTIVPYRQLRSWDFPAYNDVYLIDLKRGSREKVLTKLQWQAKLSPTGKYLYWWQRQDSSWYAMDLKRREPLNLSRFIPHPVYNEVHDWVYQPNPWGSGGWTEDDKTFLIYDRHDIWAVDPAGKFPPRAITEKVGRQRNLRFHYISLDPEAIAIDPEAPMLLSAFDWETKDAGYFRDRVQESMPPQQLILMSRHFTGPVKAKKADILRFTRENIHEFPDLWVSDSDFSDMKQMSNANPQQVSYNWGTVEQLSWTSLDGVPLKGLLYKPENLDPSAKYPMIVYFYEKNSHNLHRHKAPAAHRSVINPTFYASRGYLVFVPDIPYTIGYPGESACNAILPGITSLIEQGFVDSENIGVQGHSWAGYQIAYLVTKTHIFKAAAAGAPVANMISAYGGIRWETGLSRMFQYERTQSRIGGSLWEYPLRYIENSPIFQADKIETPLLMMHNDHDGHVPWYQAIEMFTALRRLGKPAWLINYSGEPHWPMKYHKKVDWQTRLQQYFDHFLKGAPAPEWLARGIPAIRKGKTLGLELVGEE